MKIRLLNKIQPVQWLSAVGLLGMMALCIKVAVAISGLSATFTPSSMPTGVVAQPVVSNPTLNSGTESVFISDFEKQYWSGNIYDYPIDAYGVVNTSGERWSGGLAPNLAAQNFSTGRFIGTMSDTGSKVPFLATSLSTAQQTALATTVQATSFTATQIVNFLRGDHSFEGLTALRQRFIPGATLTPTVLGDIVHGRPIYLADATNPTVFVGANDGMLHAIDVNSGTESWAYVPSMLLSKMKGLAANPYVHDYYVDGQLAVGTTNANTRFLVGALGAGGKGLYALNIDGTAGLTAASDQVAANKVMWEITPTAVNYASTTNYANLGYTLSAPVIKTINNNGVAQRVVLVGNGFNNGGDYQAYLYVINADDGTLVRAIKADSSCGTPCTGAIDGSSTSPNGLMNLLAFDSQGLGYTDTVYAGDLNGNMWKFNLIGAALPSAWTVSVLYVAGQPITASPSAIKGPYNTGFMVNFATGSIFTGTQPAASAVGATGDLGDTSTFYVYGVWDGAPSGNTQLFTPSPGLVERCYDTAGVSTTALCSSTSTTSKRVRRISPSNPNYLATSGSVIGYKGWKVALPIGGERVAGDGSFISSGRYYFSTYNPTISYLVPSTTSYVWGENWQIALDALTGGSTVPFMDMNGDGTVSAADRIKYDALENTTTTPTNSPIMTTDGVEVGQWSGRGVQSQPVLVKLANLFTTLFNTNPDVTIPTPTVTGTGVTGGHFDEDIYFGGTVPAAAATATITLTAQNKGVKTALGGVTIDGVQVVPPMILADGSSTSANATTIANNVTGGIYTGSATGNTVTITAPVGAAYNGKTLVLVPGTIINPITPGVNASQSITFTNSTSITPTVFSIMVNGTECLASNSPGSAMSSTQLAKWVSVNLSTACAASLSVGASSSTVTYTANTAQTGINITSISVSSTTPDIASSTVIGTPKYKAGTAGGTKASVSFSFNNSSAVSLTGFGISVTEPTGVKAVTMATTSTGSAMTSSQLATWVAANASLANYSVTASGSKVTITANSAAATTWDISAITFSGTTPALTYTTGTAVAGVTAGSGQTNITSAMTTTVFSGGSDGGITGDTCTGASGSQCTRDTHDHQYDKIYDVTGVDMLNPNDVNFKLSRGIANQNQNFKVIAMNQYLNPAIQLNIGNSNYLPAVNFGYVSVQGYTTGATLDLATLPTYNQNPVSSGDGFAAPKFIASLVFNMPVDALTAKNWWGNGDIRAGLIPTQPGCVYSSVGPNDGNMYQPVIPPANGVDGPGTNGYNSSTTPATATGVRHNGAFTLEIIDASTPNSAMEMQIAGRPEYGWRVKSALYSKYVLTEYTTYWHHPNKFCYSDAGWIKAPGPDTAGNPPTPKHTAGATDPKIGNLSGTSGTVIVTNVTVVGNTTTLTYANGTSTVIIRVVNSDGTVTTITINFPVGVTVGATATVNSDKSVTVIIGGVSTTIAAGSSSTLVNGTTITNSTTANSAGATGGGGGASSWGSTGSVIGTKRIAWKELNRK